MSIFKSLPEQACIQLLECMKPVGIVAGERFIHQGDTGDSMYLIRDGGCVVTVERDGDERTPAVRKTGDLVGEMAICTGEKRMAHVNAQTDMLVWRMDRIEFDQLCLAYPALRRSVTEIVTGRFSESAYAPQRTIGRYVITDMIGEGAWAIVYRGVHVPLNMPVAIKMLKLRCNTLLLPRRFCDRLLGSSRATVPIKETAREVGGENRTLGHGLPKHSCR